MKLRACAPALLLSFIAPVLLTETGLTSLPGCEQQALAQGADAVTEVARQRYEEGVKAYDTGRFEDARAAFLQAYALKRHPAVLLNLGQSELRSNHPEDAGNHLQQFLREHKAATPEQQAAAEKGIAEAKRKTGFIIVIADAYGADISIDGASVGKTPLLDPVFVPQGKHTVFATYQGKSATTQVDARAGTAAAANLTLGTAGAAPPPAPAPAQPATPPAATPPAPAPPAAQPAAPPAQPLAPTQGAAGSPPPANGVSFSSSGGMGTMTPDETTSGREPLLHWYARKPLAWVGTGVTVVGLGLGIGGLAGRASASSNADDIAAAISAYAAQNASTLPAGRKDQPCGPRDNPSGDLAGFETACQRLRDELDSHDTATAVMWAGVAVTVVGVAGTVTYAMIDWYPKKSRAEQPASSGPRLTAVAPVIAPGHAGLGLAGTF